jgi:hypothetical protein
VKLNKNEDGCRPGVIAGDHEENVSTSMYSIKPYISNPTVANRSVGSIEGCKIVVGIDSYLRIQKRY